VVKQTETYDSYLKRIEESWHGLPDKPEENPVNTLRALWFTASGFPKAVSFVKDGELPALNDKQRKSLEGLIEERISGTPLAYLTGRQEYMGIEFLAGPGAMIPRKETEILGKAALEVVKKAAAQRGNILVVDVCTGSGNLALTLACLEPKSTVFGTDLSQEAVELAQRNVIHLGTNKVEFIQGDLLKPYENEQFLGKIDVITCNPPYIASSHVKEMPAEISKYEPELAFNGGMFGINLLTRLIREAPRFLKPASWLCFEVGLGQGAGLAHSLQANKAYQSIKTFPDENGEVRALVAQTL
jgi:release factor glutamine methyltransferase